MSYISENISKPLDNFFFAVCHKDAAESFSIAPKTIKIPVLFRKPLDIFIFDISDRYFHRFLINPPNFSKSHFLVETLLTFSILSYMTTNSSEICSFLSKIYFQGNRPQMQNRPRSAGESGWPGAVRRDIWKLEIPWIGVPFSVVPQNFSAVIRGRTSGKAGSTGFESLQVRKMAFFAIFISLFRKKSVKNFCNFFDGKTPIFKTFRPKIRVLLAKK